MVETVINLSSVRSVKDFIEEANDHILRLESALYDILDCKDLQIAKEIAADVLDEDLEIYLEEDDLEELDFDDDTKLPWKDIPEGED